ncbi:hypothetical protein BCR36DRAFT_290324, partial [Piromyces finnis]
NSSNSKPLNKSHHKSNTMSLDLQPQNSKKMTKHSSLDNIDSVKLEKSHASLHKYNSKESNSNIRNSSGPLSPLNKELQMDLDLSGIPNQNEIEKVNINDEEEEDEIIVPPNGIISPYLDSDMANINDTFKSMKMKQKMIGHNRSHSVGATPQKNNSAMAQEKYLSLINGSQIPNANTMDSHFMFTNTTTNINTSSKIPSLTSIIDTPPITDSTTPSLECAQSNEQAQTNPSHILNMLSTESNDEVHKEPSNHELKSYDSSNFPSISSLDLSYTEKAPNKINEKSFVENESFSISQSTIKNTEKRNDIVNDSIFDNEISFNTKEEEEDMIEEIIEVNTEDLPPLETLETLSDDGIDDVDIDIKELNKKRRAKMKNQNSSAAENDYIYVNENTGEKINKIEIIEIEIEDETPSHEINHTTEIINDKDIEEELENEIFDDTKTQSSQPHHHQQQQQHHQSQEMNDIEKEILRDDSDRASTESNDNKASLSVGSVHKSIKSHSSTSSHNEIKNSKSVKTDRSSENSRKEIKTENANNNDNNPEEQAVQEGIPPPKLNKTDLNIDIQKVNDKVNVKRSKSINIFKSHERSRSLDLKFDKKHILGIIFNKKDSSSSKKASSSNPPSLPPKSSSSPIKKSNTTKSATKGSNVNTSTKPSNNNFNGFKIPEFNFNGFIKSNSPIVNRKLQRRHSISSPEKTDLDPTIYNSRIKKSEGMSPTSKLNRHGTINTPYLNTTKPQRIPMDIEKDSDIISVEDIQASLFNVSKLSSHSSRKDDSEHSSHSKSSSSSHLRKERLKLGRQESPHTYKKSSGSTTPTNASPKKYIFDLEEDEELQPLNPITTTPILQDAINDILDKELPEIKIVPESPDIISMDNIPIYNSVDIENIPIYTESEIIVQPEEEEDKEEETEKGYFKMDDLKSDESHSSYNDKSNGSIMALINKNWKLLSEDLSEENIILPSKVSKNNNTKKTNFLKSQTDNNYLDFSNNMDNISPILPPLSKTLNINIGNAFATVENEYLEKKSPRREDNGGNINHKNNKYYRMCVNNIGNPFLNPNNVLEVSENDTYKGKTTICSPPIDVESIIGSILDSEDKEDTTIDEVDTDDNKDIFEKNLQDYQFTSILPENSKKVDQNENDNKENVNANIINYSSVKDTKSNTTDKNKKSSYIIPSVTSFRKYSLPTSNINKTSIDENQHLHRSRSGNGKNAYGHSCTPLSSYNNHYFENNSSNNTSGSRHHKNKKYERILAVHDYKGRDNREMSLEKGDILIVKQRKGTWIYGVKESNIFKIDIITNQQIKFKHREHGWVPATYVKPYDSTISS